MIRKKIDKGRIVVFRNREKDDHETWDLTIYYRGSKKYIRKGNANPANIIAPFRLIIQGPPNSGKTNIIRNLIAEQKPYFEKIYISHPDSCTTEYEDIDYTLIRGIPSPNHALFRNDYKKLWVIDDCEMKLMLTKEEKSKLDKIFSYVSTHHNLSIIISSQNISSQIYGAIPKYCNFGIFMKIEGKYNLMHVGDTFGIPYRCLKNFFSKHGKGKFDNICIDRTKNTPYLIRKNIYDVLDPEWFYNLENN